MPSAASLAISSSAPARSGAKVTIATASAVARTSDDGYVSFTMDWWAPNQGARPEGWGDKANVLEVDLSSPKLRSLVRALGPAYLRIGGSLDKDVVYHMPTSMGEPCPNVTLGGLCLTTERWDQLHEFCAATDSKLVFGLSYPQVGNVSKLCPNGCKGTSGVWNSTQAEALFVYSKQKGYTAATTMWGFELGEELTNFQLGSAQFAAYTASYRRAAKMLTSIFARAAPPGPGSQGRVQELPDGGVAPVAATLATAESSARPKLMGPCPGMSWPQLDTWCGPIATFASMITKHESL